ncbi:unnamed protein product [Soboliphyme baturini]|uniref:Transposase n=1 Tax=Soboliphyme baturini TaxID=241478 RepID=A0A183IWI9_9BILA|nr:unnamed protein product [Soboliphyme baturini]
MAFNDRVIVLIDVSSYQQRLMKIAHFPSVYKVQLIFILTCRQCFRWLDYLPIGKVIRNTRFICCKVPLKKVFCKNVFYLAFAVIQYGYQLGLVIDLTYTDRYYSKTVYLKCSLFKLNLLFACHRLVSERLFQQLVLVIEAFQSWSTTRFLHKERHWLIQSADRSHPQIFHYQ